MPSSLIIVALAAAWLVVLVPMIARKRQAVARTADTELAARVVRSGSGAEEEFAMSEPTEQTADPEDLDELEDAEEAEDVEEFEEEPVRRPRVYEPDSERRYRPGRGGFDPEAAEIAARAKYAFRQRVVLILIIFAVATAVGGGFLMSTLWWAHAAVDAGLVFYLGYLRRQVRIENEIRQRRLARLARASRPAPRRADDFRETEAEAPRRELVGVERRPSPASRRFGSAVVVDVDDEDPAFHELDDPGQLPFRRAVGE